MGATSGAWLRFVSVEYLFVQLSTVARIKLTYIGISLVSDKSWSAMLMARSNLLI